MPQQLESSEERLAVMKVDEVLEELGLSDPKDIIPYLTKIKTNLQ
jgi:hypothetical protein